MGVGAVFIPFEILNRLALVGFGFGLVAVAFCLIVLAVCEANREVPTMIVTYRRSATDRWEPWE